MPAVLCSVSSRASSFSRPAQPSRKPTNWKPPRAMPLRTTARIAAFRPGQSPPPVSTPTRIGSLMPLICGAVWQGGGVSRGLVGMVVRRRLFGRMGSGGILRKVVASCLVDAASFQGQAGADPPSSQVRQRALTAVAGVSLAALADIGELSEQLGVRLLSDHPAFGQDAALEAEMHVAIHANLQHVFERVMPTGAPETLVAPPDALRFTESVLRRGIETSDLIQAYRTGQNLAW